MLKLVLNSLDQNLYIFSDKCLLLYYPLNISTPYAFFPFETSKMASDSVKCFVCSCHVTVNIESRLNMLQLKEVLVNMLLDGEALELVHDILEIMPVESWTVRDALTDAMSTVCTHFR